MEIYNNDMEKFNKIIELMEMYVEFLLDRNEVEECMNCMKAMIRILFQSSDKYRDDFHQYVQNYVNVVEKAQDVSDQQKIS